MSNVIASPGVQFNEIDLTLTARQPNNNTVYMAGYASRGPSYIPTYITSLSEFENVFGTPTNSAERYLYQSARQILVKTQSSLLITRLPYDPEPLIVQDNTKIVTHNVLVYPVTLGYLESNTFDTATTYTLEEPISLLVTRDEYDAIKQNQFDWSNTIDLTSLGYGDDPALANTPIGLIVTNDSDTAVNNLFEGMYVGIADNSDTNPSLGYTCITGVKVMNASPVSNWNFTPHVGGDIFTGAPGAVHIYNGYGNWLTTDSQRFTFTLSQATLSVGIQDTISEIMIKTPRDFAFEENEYQDSIILSLFALSKSTYETTKVKLADRLLESHIGSFNENKTRTDSNGGAPKSAYIENIINTKSSYISVHVNPLIARQDWEDTSSATISNIKKVRIANNAKNLYALGSFTTINKSSAKRLGYIPGKLDTALRAIELPEEYPLDITCDAGLSTMWTSIACKNYDVSTSSVETDIYLLDTTFNDELPLGSSATNATASGNPTITDLWGKDALNPNFRSSIVESHNAIASMYTEFASVSRRDHIHVSDPLRYIFVQGRDSKNIYRSKESSLGAFNFSEELYWPLFNLYKNISSSYVTVYPEWFKVSDMSLKRDIWVPSSAVCAANIINSSPFDAPAGFTRGVISGVADIAVSPTQKQRDLLYKICMNSIATFPSDGIVMYGQKTLLNRPSAFDRLNVRRTFLYLEKTTNAVAKYFVFEPNTVFTRRRVVNILTPIFEYAKRNNGVYDYKIVCDESNNTSFTIDNNQLIIDIYIKPVRTAEFILVNFYATRTDQNFSELIS